MNAVVTLAAVIGGFAALGTLVWAMVGNPNMLGWLQNRFRNSPPAPPPAKRRVVNVSWSQLETAATAFATRISVTYDLVVGVQPDGISLGNLLAGRLQTRYAAMDKHYPKSKRTPFFVFDPDKHSRSLRDSVTQFTSSSDIVNPSRILVVDGVTTFGNGLLKAQEEILARFNNAQIDFYVYAVDQSRLAACHPEIADRVTYHTIVDNYVTWLHFPWDAA